MNKVRKILSVFVITLFIITIKFTNSSFALTGKVTADRLRVRKSASTDSEILIRATYGEKLEIVETTGNWYKIKFKNVDGYVYKDYVELIEEPEPSKEPAPEPTSEPSETPSQEPSPEPSTEPSPEPAKEPEPSQEPIEQTVTELGDRINKDISGYIIPSYSGLTIIDLKENTKVKIITTLANWAKIEYNKQQVWVPKTILMKETKKEEPKQEEQKQEDKKEEEPKQEVSKTAYVSIDQSVNLRKEPSKTSESLAKLKKYEKVLVISDTEEWYKVKYNNIEGYILGSLLTIGEPPNVSSR